MKIMSILVFLALVISPISVVAGENLTGEEIRATFEGNTYHWSHMRNQVGGKRYLDATGKLIDIRNGKSQAGSWSIKGDKICFTGKKTACLNIEKDGEFYYLVKGGSGRVVKIKKVEAGDTT